MDSEDDVSRQQNFLRMKYGTPQQTKTEDALINLDTFVLPGNQGLEDSQACKCQSG